MRVGELIRYLPALAVGILLAEISLIMFSYTATYMLKYLISVVDLNANSIQYLWLILHDVSLVFILSGSVYFGYRNILSTLPDDLSSAILMQLPIAYLCLYLLQPSYNFSSLASCASSISSVTASISVLLIYGLNRFVRQRSKAKV